MKSMLSCSRNLVVILFLTCSLACEKKEEVRIAEGTRTSGSYVNHRSGDSTHVSVICGATVNPDSALPYSFSGRDDQLFASSIHFALKEATTGIYSIGSTASFSYSHPGVIFSPRTDFVANRGTIEITGVNSDGSINGNINVQYRERVLLFDSLFASFSGSFEPAFR